MQLGPYHHPMSRMSGVCSLRVLINSSLGFWLFIIASLVAFPAYPIWLSDKTDGEASFSVYKTNNPAELHQPFLLITCTGQIVTHCDLRMSTARYSRRSSI